MRYVIILFIIIIRVSFCLYSYADTVYMKDDSVVKGLVVEEYKDRITLSTYEGEKVVLRSDIKSIKYDTKEQKLMELGRIYDSKGQFDRAVPCYKEAIRLNPDFSEAKAAFIASSEKLLHEREALLRKEIARRSMIVNWREREKNSEVSSAQKGSLTMKALGINITQEKELFIIDEVELSSRAYKACGVRKGDVLVAIWGKLIQYSDLNEVVSELAQGPKHSEVNFTLEKDLYVPLTGLNKNLYKKIGAVLKMDYNGLFIERITGNSPAEISGLRERDLVVAIEDKMARYLSTKEVINTINKCTNANINFTVRRNVTLKREGE